MYYSIYDLWCQMALKSFLIYPIRKFSLPCSPAPSLIISSFDLCLAFVRMIVSYLANLKRITHQKTACFAGYPKRKLILDDTCSKTLSERKRTRCWAKEVPCSDIKKYWERNSMLYKQRNRRVSPQISGNKLHHSCFN